MAEGKSAVEPHHALLPLEEACVCPHLDIGDTLVVITEDGNMVGWKVPRDDAVMAHEKNKNEHLRYLISSSSGPIIYLLTPISLLVRLRLTLCQLYLTLHRHLDVLTEGCLLVVSPWGHTWDREATRVCHSA